MAQPQPYLVFVAVLACSAITFNKAHPIFTKIQWVNVTESEVLLLNNEPAGVQGQQHLYLCRVDVSGDNFAGKLQLQNGSISCRAPVYGSEHATSSFQVKTMSFSIKI